MQATDLTVRGKRYSLALSELMVSLEYVRRETESTEDIRAMLEGRVFHVTMSAYWPAIKAAGYLLPNTKGEFQTTFGYSKSSFFRNRGCVSLFDFRGSPTEEMKGFRFRCDPLQPALPDGEGIVILVFDSSINKRLVPWTKWKDEKAYGEMVVPHVEAGHPGPIPICAIERSISFRRLEDPECIAAMVRKARPSRRKG